jgi:hemolysin activation/secretion protein
MNYDRLSYDTLLNGERTRLGLCYSGLNYWLGGRLSDLDAHGIAQDASLDLKQPLIRSRDVDLYAQLQYDHLQLNDDIDVSDIVNRRHLSDLLASLSGDVHNHLFGGAVNPWSASWTYGYVTFANAVAEVAQTPRVHRRRYRSRE